MHDSIPDNIKILEEKILFVDNSNRTCYLIPCNLCGATTWHPQYAVLKSVRERNQNFFCNQKCSKLFYKKSQTINCENCGKSFEKSLNQIKKTKHHFCSQSCAATYHNSHKNYGTRRSKLEKFLEEQIKIHFPNEKCLFNNVKTIGSELDIYFPEIKLAIQLNGPVHFKPIYGTEKYNKIVEQDHLKREICKTLHIKLIEIDVSKDRSDEIIKIKRWQEVQSLITTFIIK